MAYDTGVAEDELIEFLIETITESGCPGEPLATLSLKTYELNTDKQIDAAEICCREENLN